MASSHKTLAAILCCLVIFGCNKDKSNYYSSSDIDATEEASPSVSKSAPAEEPAPSPESKPVPAEKPVPSPESEPNGNPFLGVWTYTHKENTYSREFTKDGFCILREGMKERWKRSYELQGDDTAIVGRHHHILLKNGTLLIEDRYQATKE